jgi:hypothetical protein
LFRCCGRGNTDEDDHEHEHEVGHPSLVSDALSAANEHKYASRLLKNYVGTPDLHWLACLGQQENILQDAQKGQTSHPPNPGAPRRAVPRARPQRAIPL